MKGVILAGGFGKRLKPITDNRPKPMIEILGKPIIEWQIKLLSKNNITEIIICVGYLKEQIINHIASGNKFKVKVAYMVEEEPLGTGGALKNTQPLLKDEKNGFFMINGDILTNIEFNILSHKNDYNSIAVVPLKSPFGIVDFNDQQFVTGFKEKPNLVDKWINAGIYFFNQEIFDYLPDKGNIETTALPAMANEQKLKAKKFEKSFWKSIDSHKDIEESSKRAIQDKFKTSMREKIGFSIGSLLKAKDIIEFASIVDKNENIHSIWAPESWGKEVFSTLGAISQVTNRMIIGSSIVNIYSRTPATIAMGGITLDNLSSKRAILGLGTSTSVLVENLHGIKFEKPLIRMKEYIQSIKLLLRSKKVNYHGQSVNIKNFKLLEHSRDDIPIFVAAVNSGMIGVAKKYADGAILYLKPKDELKVLIENIKIENQNQNFMKALVIITSVSNKDPKKAIDRAARTLAFYISVGSIYYESLIKTKYKSEVEKIYNDYNKYGLGESIKNITDEMLSDLVIAGSINDCNSQIKRILKIGIDLPILQMNPIKDTSDNMNYKDFTDLWK